MAELDHVAFGVSVEDRQYGLPRIRSLQDTPARIRFLSVEPLLADLGSLDLHGIDWVIVGGESGPHARPMLRNWVVNILAFAERVLPRAADLWVQASLEQRQRFQQLFFPDGIVFDGNGFVGTRVTAPAFSYLREIETGNERMVDQTGIEPVTS